MQELDSKFRVEQFLSLPINFINKLSKRARSRCDKNLWNRFLHKITSLGWHKERKELFTLWICPNKNINQHHINASNFVTSWKLLLEITRNGENLVHKLMCKTEVFALKILYFSLSVWKFWVCVVVENLILNDTDMEF